MHIDMSTDYNNKVFIKSRSGLPLLMIKYWANTKQHSLIRLDWY